MTDTQEMVGDYYVIGPQMFATTPTPQPDTVLSWAGENFTVQRAPLDRAELLSLLDSAYGSPLAHHQAIADRIMRLAGR